MRTQPNRLLLPNDRLYDGCVELPPVVSSHDVLEWFALGIRSDPWFARTAFAGTPQMILGQVHGYIISLAYKTGPKIGS